MLLDKRGVKKNQTRCDESTLQINVTNEKKILQA